MSVLTKDDLLAEARASVNPVNADEAQSLLEQGYKALDIREPAEFMMGHLPGAENASLRAKEWKDDLVFLHEVQSGPADKSYGVQVAKLAGLPKKAVRRAGQILKQLEAEPSAPESLPLFAAASFTPDTEDNAGPEEIVAPSEADKALQQIDPDSLTPREALDLIYRLKALASD